MTTATSAPTRTSGTVPIRGALVVFLFALALRLAAIFVLDSPRDVDKGLWEWGYEAGNLANSLAEGHGYSGPWNRDAEPWNLGSGASAWLAPAYPAFVAQLLSIFGGLNAFVAITLFVVQSVLAAATCVILWALGCAIDEPRAGRVAAWTLALYPAAIWNASHTVWDTTLVAFGIVAFLWALFALSRGASVARWALFGLGFGALLLCNPAPLTFAPIVAWWIWREHRTTRATLSRLLAFGLVAFATITPWMLRNRRDVGAFALRTNLGVELRVGNNDDANGRYQLDYHPSHSKAEFTRYREMGEVPYAAWAMDEFQRWARAHPARFIGLCLRRAQIFWIGEDPFTDARRDRGLKPSEDWKSWIKWLQHLTAGVLGLSGAYGLARRRPEGRALAAVMLLFPAAYYLTHFMERYRYPIEPLIVFAAAWFVLRVWDRRVIGSRA